MVDHTIRSVIRFRPHHGEEADFDELVHAAVAAAREEPGTVDHIWWSGPGDGEVSLIEQYLDSDAMLSVMQGDLGRRILPRMMRIARLEAFELYGPISAKLFSEVQHLAPRIGKPLAAFRRSRLDQAIERIEAERIEH